MKVFALIFAIVCSLLVPVTGYLALFAPMAMDAPGSGKSVGKRYFVLTMMTAPIAMVFGVLMAWRKFGLGAYCDSLVWAVLGLSPFLLGMLLLYLNWLEPHK